MDAETLRWVLIGSLTGGGLLLLAASLWFRVAGSWEREPDAEGTGGAPEVIELTSLGPFVFGRRDLALGRQEFSGVQVGRVLYLRRRDHGQRLLAAQGFPGAIAQKLDGQVTGKLRLVLSADGAALSGGFSPQKVEFTHQPPRITQSYFLPPQPRTYRRVSPVAVGEPMGMWPDAVPSESGGGEMAKQSPRDPR